jgi:RNA-binding protein 39
MQQLGALFTFDRFTMGEDKPTTETAAAATEDEEARLRERLRAKAQQQKEDEERRLKERLKAKARSRRSEGGDGKNGEGSNNGDTTNGDNPKNAKGDDPRGSPRDRENNNASRSRGRDSNSRDRRSSSRGYHRDRRGPPPGRGRGPPGPGGWVPRGPPGLFYDDPYGRGPPDMYGRGPPPPGPGPYRGSYGGGPPGARGGGFGGPPPRRGPPPPSFYEQDQYGRAPRRYNRDSLSRSRSVSPHSYSSRSRSISSASSHSRSRSRSLTPESEEDRRIKRSRSRSEDRRRHHNKHRRRGGSRGRRRSRSPSVSDSSMSGSSSSDSSSSSEESDAEDERKNSNAAEDTFTKDQRTVFVNQLVMRTTSKDIRRYFRRKVGAKVNEVILLKDRRTGKHKGCAYVEMKSMEDVGKALNVSGQPPDFQRFPILVKPSEAEKNYLIPASSATLTANMMGATTAGSGPMIGPNGQLIEAQKVYVGSLDPSITQEHLFKLFSQFGDLTKVSLQMDPASGISKGYAFLSFRDPKEANLAIQTMSNQVLAGRCMKTGWASQNSGTPGVQVVTSDEFPADASARAQKAHIALAQLAIGAGLTVPDVGQMTSPGVAGGQSRIPTVAEARQSLATSAASGLIAVAPAVTVATVMPGQVPAAVAPSAAMAVPATSLNAKLIGGADDPTKHLLVHNMYDKDEETEEGWAEEIKLEFQEECSKFGKIEQVTVMSTEPGGKIYASFETIEAAKTCASSLAGRWFDKRQLRVEFVPEDQLPKNAA